MRNVTETTRERAGHPDCAVVVLVRDDLYRRSLGS
jgi:hypothetical protein